MRPRTCGRRGRAALAAALAVLACSAALAPRAARAAPAASAGGDWASYLRSTAAASVQGTPLATSLGPVLTAHEFSAPLAAVQASNSYTGGNGRLRRVVSDLSSGRPIKVVAIGGAATNGSDATQRGVNDYFARYVAFLSAAFPGARVEAVRAPVGLAPSGVVAACLGQYLPDDDADLVLLEMTANDGLTMDSAVVDAWQPRGYEILTRKILSGSKQPALVMVQTLAPGMGNGTAPFYMTPESPHYAAVAAYYDTPTVSLRNALWPAGARTADGGLDSPSVSADDGSTPKNYGHAALADALVFLTQRTAQDLQLLPFGDYDTRAINADVPSKAMYGGVTDRTDKTLRRAICGWTKNATIARGGGCPASASDMCDIDYSSWDSVREGYKNVKEASLDGDDGQGALIGGIVGGVVGGLALIGGTVAYAIVRQRRRAAAQQAAWDAKLSSNNGGGGGARVGGGASGNALPITASAATTNGAGVGRA